MSEAVEPTPEEIFNQGVSLLNSGQAEAALELFESVSKEQPDVPTGHWMRGVALSVLGRHEDAIGAFEAGLDIVPDEPFALYNLGMACLHLGRWAEAMRSLRLALQLGLQNPMALLLLGFATGAEFGAVWPLGFGEWMRNQWERNEAEEAAMLDMQDAVTVALLAFAYAALGQAEEAEATAISVAEKDPALGQRLAPALRAAIDAIEPRDLDDMSEEDRLSRFAELNGLDLEDEEEEEESEGADDDWEAKNEQLLMHLARFAHFNDRDIEPAPEAYEGLYRAFLDAYFMVPLEEEPQEIEEEDGTRISFTLRLRPHDAFDGGLVAVAFTGLVEANAFLDPDYSQHRVVVPGSVLASLLADMARDLETGEEPRLEGEFENSDDPDGALAALIVNPSGPHPFVFGLRDLLFLASGGVPLNGDHTIVAEGEDFTVRPYEGDFAETMPEEMLRELRAAIGDVASGVELGEVFYFEVVIGDGQPHLGLGVAPGTAEQVDAVGKAVLPVWENYAAPHAVYDVLPMSGKLAELIREHGARLWPG